MKSKNYIAIIAGGKGTRLWPMSRNNSPKQLQNLIGKNTMIQDTFIRLQNFMPSRYIYISTNDNYKKEIQKQLPKIPKKNYIIEPMAKNTAPAIGLVALKIFHNDPNAIVATIHADHLVTKPKNFLKALESCQKIVTDYPEMIGTVGIKPTCAHTGLGYIQREKILKNKNNILVYKVKKFVEKPNLIKAKEYVATGKYFWNAGYFIFKAKTILQYFKKYEPKIYQGLVNIKKSIGKKNEAQITKKEFEKMPELAIDYLIEKLNTVFVAPANLGWNDIGSWQVLQEILSKQLKSKNNNIERGNHIGIDNKDCLIYAQDKLISTIGLKNLIIVDTDDALLVCDKSRSQDIKKLIKKLKSNKKFHQYL